MTSLFSFNHVHVSYAPDNKKYIADVKEGVLNYLYIFILL